jgi:diguanylate cyclase (GGDEF)-like protein
VPAEAGRDAFVDERRALPARPVASASPPVELVVGALCPLIAAAALLAPRAGLPLSGTPASLAGLFACGLAALLALAPWAYARATSRPSALPSATILVGAATGALLVVIASTGGARSPLLFAPHAVAAIAGAVLRPRALSAVVPAGLLGFAGALFAGGAQPGVLVVQALLFAGFASLGRALVFSAIQAAGARADARVDAELLRWVDDARLFRVLGARSETGDDESKRTIAATESVREGTYRLLRLGAHALEPDASALYLLDPGGEQLVLKEQHVAGDDEHRARLAVKGSVLSLALKKRRAQRLCDPQGEGLSPHREGPVRALLCVPLIDREQAIGVLTFDRSTARPFDEADERTALALADEVAQAMRGERVLVALDAERRENQRVFAAARAFGGVVKKEEAVKVALKCARKIAPVRAAAFVEIVKISSRERIVVRAAAGDGGEIFGGTRVTQREGAPIDPETWVGRAIQQGAMLPHVPLAVAGKTRGVIEADDGRAADFGDLRVFPLFAQGERTGALIVAANEGARFSRSILDSLGVVADMAGVAFAGAGYYETLEKAATTDGLTGLYNRRTLNERLSDAIARAERTGNPLSLVLADVDHFKSVNDTYGHQVGDDVLVGVARTFLRCARVTDVVARYGGEEFCLVLESTDSAGAAHLAERIRRSIAAMRFDTDLGPLEVTSSFGVSALADHAETAEGLLKAADESLYRAKEKGRNRVVIAPSADAQQDSVSQPAVGQ